MVSNTQSHLTNQSRDESKEAQPQSDLDLSKQVEIAKRLLFHAAEAGIDLEAGTRDKIMSAATTSKGGWTHETAADLLDALTKIAAKLKPVTAESLAVCENGQRVDKTVRGYRKVAILLAIVIIPFSLLTFVTSAVSEAMLKDIDAANLLAVKLSDEIEPPEMRSSSNDTRGSAYKLPPTVTQADLIRDLQTFAATIRAIDARARQLNVFLLNVVDDPNAAIRKSPEEMRKTFELPADLPDLSKALADRIQQYQRVRYFAQSIRELISTVYGAIATSILPVLYALLGACAYLLRSFEMQIKNRTFTYSDAYVAHFVTAAISGGVVGLFKNFTMTQSASISPLAIAFLVGYAVDVFFSFLDAFVQTFNRSRVALPPQR